MANYRVAEVPFQGQTVLYIEASYDLVRENKMDRLFEMYQTEDQTVLVDVHGTEVLFFYQRGKVMEDFSDAMGPNGLSASMFNFGPIQQI